MKHIFPINDINDKVNGSTTALQINIEIHYN